MLLAVVADAIGSVDLADNVPMSLMADVDEAVSALEFLLEILIPLIGEECFLNLLGQARQLDSRCLQR